MAKTVIKGIEGLKAMKGKEVGVSDWHTVTQEEINTFAKATHDHQWIHIDPERCKRESPWGQTIAHGYYTISLAPYLLGQMLSVEGVQMGINYGINKLRFPTPLKVGRKVRARAELMEVEDIANGVQATLKMTFEAEGEEKPSCVAEVIYRYYG
ncbi:MAG: MaoC family dehydratase [Candidatus Abyssobacteria bacterium SURF_17]|jgi:acyl dehydratase|uniref:MaoC family dehydratase n=1 Tax=Candidatus Abyssobacteria bacterium SURF_17 TaxID=2093361 RepID=A0A419F8W7_9BACT|nr:MAG: MaoC family dehydratase [Candidatus Abyssubacteria bacterium SURF_17]